MVFAGLRSLGSKGQNNAIKTDAAGDVYLAFDQGDGIRVLKVANDGGALRAQVRLGAAGDAVAALVLDATGNVYIAGTSTSGSLAGTSGAAFGSSTAGTTTSFVAKLDESLNLVFLTFTGGTRISASALAANQDGVFVTGIAYGTDLPVSTTAIEQAPAVGSVQNGFVEAFSADGKTLVYATYVTGALGDTTPTGIAVDSNGDAFLVGSTTASGFPTIAALVPSMVSTPSGFLLRLTPAGDGIVYSTFVPGTGLSSVALDSTGVNLLVSGQVALGQFPVDTVSAPLVPTTYQVLLRISLDGSTVESGTVIAPGLQSVLAAASGGAAWVGGSFSPGVAPLLPQPALSGIGNGYAVRVAPGIGVDETVRIGGLANGEQTFASVPVAVNGVAVDGRGALFAAGFAQPTASASLLSTETYDFPLRGGPTEAMPSAIVNAEVTSSECGGSLCSGSGGYLTKVDTADAGPSLAFSADAVPLVILRNLGSVTAQGLQVTTNAGNITSSCGSQLAPGEECDVFLTGGSAGTLTVSTSNGGGTSMVFASYTSVEASRSLVFAPKELDFGIQTAASPAELQTITISNLGSAAVTFSEGIVGTPESSTPFSEISSSCPLAEASAEKVLAAGASCTITVGFSALAGTANDGFVQGEWTIGSADVLLTGYSQSASLSLSADEIDFGTEIQGGLTLPRYLYISNSSVSPRAHSPVSLPASSPFSVTDGCPDILAPGTVCRMTIEYLSGTAPSADALTLALDEGLTALLTGQTMPPQTLGGSTLTPSLTVSPTSVTFDEPVSVTGVSAATQTVSVTNSGTTPVPLTIGLSGDFSDVTGCGITLPAGATCAVAINFTPSQSGVRQGLMTVSAGAGTSPLTVALSGTGTGILNGDNGTLGFASSPVGQPMVQVYKVGQSFDRLSVQATGPYLVTLVEDTGFGFGVPPSSAYVASGAGSCHDCWLGVQFQPTSPGQQVGTLSLSSAPNGLPYALHLIGSGTATSGLIVSPTVVSFGAIPINSSTGATRISLTNLNSDGTAIIVSGVQASNSFTTSPVGEGSGTCSGSLAYAASCFVVVQFAPTTVGPSSGSVMISTSTGEASASLTGTGTADPGISVSPTSLVYVNTPGFAGGSQSVTVRNTGTQNASVGIPTTATHNFALSNGCAALAPSGICSIEVTFTAGAIPIDDVLSIPITTLSSAGVQVSQTLQVALSGTYTSESQGLAVFPTTLVFGPFATGTRGSPRQLTVTNPTTKEVSISVVLPRSYELDGQACTTLAANASCSITVVFVPLENGDLPGTISLTATPVDGSTSSTELVYADGFGVGTGVLSLSGGLIVNGVFNFGSVAPGQSVSQRFQLSIVGTRRSMYGGW